MQSEGKPSERESRLVVFLLLIGWNVLAKSQTEALMPWCLDRAIVRSIHQGRGLRFPCNDRTGEVNKLFIICPFLALEYNKNTGSKFPHPFARAMAFFVAHTILKKYITYKYASFSFSYWKYSFTLPIVFVFFAHVLVALLTTKKSRWTEKKIHNAWSLQENNARSAANQSARTIFSPIIIQGNRVTYRYETSYFPTLK